MAMVNVTHTELIGGESDDQLLQAEQALAGEMPSDS